MGKYALLGFGSALFLSLIELIDTNVQLTPVFNSFPERLVFAAYFSMNLAGGSVIGLLVGSFALAASYLKRLLQAAMARANAPAIIGKGVAGLAVCSLAGFLLNQQPHVSAYAVAVLREGEKFKTLRKPLLADESGYSYLLVTGLVIACSIIWMLTRASKNWRAPVRAVWVITLSIALAAAYYVDSRVEVQLYDPSLHQSMFLACTALAMALVGTVCLSSKRIAERFSRTSATVKRGVSFAVLLALAASLSFTFARFDDNQTLKTQVFYRTTRAKQYFKLARWVLDFDRDGYSPYLGGGDFDDLRADINPGQAEVIGDGVDNNCIGGDLTAEQFARWNDERGGMRAVANPNAKRFNLIYIFVDALRPDHMGTYGYSRDTTPNLDRLAARSSLFENAYTPSPFTYAALPKFMQSSYWDGHFETWTEALSRSGHEGFLFPSRITWHLRRHIKGISHVVSSGKKGLPQAVDGVIETLSKAGQERPFFAYFYIPDPHEPYFKHKEFDYGETVTDLYDGEIAFIDAALGKLFDWMEKSGRINDTMVVLMADHGESLGERAVYKHSTQLYDEQARIPMIFYVPGVQPRRVPDYVSSVDLGTTILNAVGIEIPKDYAGVSLLPLMRGEAFEHPPVYGEQIYTHDARFVPPEKYTHPATKKFMVITQDGFKLIYNRDYFAFELYNLRDDPRELRNLYDVMPAKAEEMKRLVGRFVDVTIVSRPWDAEETWVEPPKRRLRMGVDDEGDDDE